MDKHQQGAPADELRQRAEARLKAEGQALSECSAQDSAQLIHELRTHQIELEMQNEELRRAEQALTESRDRFSDFYDFAPVGYVAIDARGLITQANLTLAAMLGVDRSTLLNRSFSALVAPADQDALHLHIRNRQQKTGSQATELRLLRADASTCWVSMQSTLARRGNSADADLLITVADISRRKQEEETLRAEKELFGSVTESMRDALVLMDHEGRVLLWNCAAEAMFGYGGDEIIGRPLHKTLAPERFYDDFSKAFSQFRQTGDGEVVGRTLELEARHKDGHEFPIELSLSSLWRDGGWCSVGVIRDISVRKQSEQALRHSEESIRLLLDSTAEAIYSLDTEGNCTLVNKSCLAMLGYRDASELLGQNMHALIHHSDADGHRYPKDACKINRAILHAKGVHVDDEVYWRKDGSSFPVSYWSYPICREGRVTGCVVTFLDISEKVKAGEALSTSHRHLEEALEGTINAVAKAVGARDPYTSGHQRRTAGLAAAIAGEMGLNEERIKGIRLGATIHDIGKIQVPAEILSKPGRLSAIEFQLVQKHAVAGFEILKDINFPWPIALIAYQHHERINGCGYPQGLKGNEICLEARIMAVADVVEAISSHRPYRPGLGVEVALDEIRQGRGVLYDTQVVDACIELIEHQRYALTEAG